VVARSPSIRRYHGFKDEDELYIRQLIQLLNDDTLPRPTTKKIAMELKEEIEPLKVLGILRRDIPSPFFQATRAQAGHHSLSPREVILSFYHRRALTGWTGSQPGSSPHRKWGGYPTVKNRLNRVQM
jgi:hypothetical protein